MEGNAFLWIGFLADEKSGVFLADAVQQQSACLSRLAVRELLLPALGLLHLAQDRRVVVVRMHSWQLQSSVAFVQVLDVLAQTVLVLLQLSLLQLSFFETVRLLVPKVAGTEGFDEVLIAQRVYFGTGQGDGRGLMVAVWEVLAMADGGLFAGKNCVLGNGGYVGSGFVTRLKGYLYVGLGREGKF